MKISYKIFAVGLVASTTIGFLGVSYAASSPGGGCSKVGQTTVVNGQKLTCSLIWVASAVSAGSATKPKTTSPTKIGIAQSKDFALISIQFSSDGFGSAQATARVENIGSGTHGALFDVTIFAADGVTPAITLTGAAPSVASGETQTVSLITTDGDLPSGQFKYAFQTTTEL